MIDRAGRVKQRHSWFASMQAVLKRSRGSFRRNLKPRFWRRKSIACFLLFLLGIGIAVFPSGVGFSSELPASSLARNAQLQFQQSQDFYERGEYDAAIASLQQAIANFEAAGNPLQGAIARGNLALAYQQRGRWELAQEAIAQSLTLLDSLDGENALSPRASLLEIQSQLKLSLGHPDLALDLGKKAEQLYRQLGDKIGVLRCQVNQSLTLQELGKYRDALQLLLPRIGNILELETRDSLLKATALRSLGTVARVVGDREVVEQVLSPFLPPRETQQYDDLDLAKWLLEQSYQTAKHANNSQSTAESLLELGHLERAGYYRAKDAHSRVPSAMTEPKNQIQFKERAMQYYRDAQSWATSNLTRVEAQLDRLSFTLEIEGREEPEFHQQKEEEKINESLVAELRSRLDTLPPSRSATFARIDLAKRLMEKDVTQYSPTIEALLLEAKDQAQHLQDARSESYASGNLAKLYELTENGERALSLTQKALLLAEEIQAFEIRYQWEWQLGKLLAERNQVKDAILTYEETIKTIDIVRKDLLDLKNPDLRFTFRDNVEPVYRELVSLLLAPGEKDISQGNLKKAIYYIDALQVAELEDFLRCNLQPEIDLNSGENPSLDPVTALGDRLEKFVRSDPQLAFMYAIRLPDQLATIVKLPGGENLLYRGQTIDENEFQATIKEIADKLPSPEFVLTEHGQTLQKIYQWTLEPFVPELERNGVNHLIFVLDGELRGIPMAALYDGQEFIIERGYSTSLSPSVQLLKHNHFNIDETQTLILGAVKDRPNFDPLQSAVFEQIEKLGQILHHFEIVSNGKFTRHTFQDKIASARYNIVHFITHGKFSSSFEETYILTDDPSRDRENYRLNINQLSRILRSTNSERPIELLVFSACETALGDRRAVLGMAGVAIKSGAEGTIGTLQDVKQDSTNELMIQFYNNLANKKLSKAESLRLAQLHLLHSKSTQDPRHWSSVVLLGY
ncbi:MAG: CHAT domain-containing protein [Cyanobacteriota bacterium]|nr:CHAT domain-containing protein [Cyanobacteriota bacterium]